jgi:hypothetical protein
LTMTPGERRIANSVLTSRDSGRIRQKGRKKSEFAAENVFDVFVPCVTRNGPDYLIFFSFLKSS